MPAGFVALQGEEEWQPCGEPGLEMRLVSSTLDAKAGKGVRIQVFRAAPDTAFRPDGDEARFRREYLLVQGSITLGGVRRMAPARADFGPGDALDDAVSEDGCLMIEVAYL